MHARKVHERADGVVVSNSMVNQHVSQSLDDLLLLRVLISVGVARWGLAL